MYARSPASSSRPSMPLTRAAVRSTLARSLHIPISPTAITVAVVPVGTNGGGPPGGGRLPGGGSESGFPDCWPVGVVGVLGGSVQAMARTTATQPSTLAMVMGFTSASHLSHARSIRHGRGVSPPHIIDASTMPGMLRSARFAVAALVGLVALLPSDVRAQGAQAQEDPPTTGIYWRNRPSIQLGEHVRLDLRLKLAYDWRRFDPQIDELPDDWRFRRAGINGEIGEDIEFQIERDLNRFGRWRDVYINWGKYRQFEVTAGRFKVPFGHEELIGIADVDFAFRSLVSTTIPPARDRGVMAHGRFLQRGFTYQVGVFDDDGDNGRLQEEQFSVTGDIGGVGPSLAAR